VSAVNGKERDKLCHQVGVARMTGFARRADVRYRLACFCFAPIADIALTGAICAGRG
jgi:hypothetical protein